MRAILGAACLVLVLGAGAARADPPWSVIQLTLPEGPPDRLSVRRDLTGAPVVLEWRIAKPRTLRLANDRLELAPAPRDGARAVQPVELVPHTRAVLSLETFAHIRFAEPTTRYAHAVLGDGIEAGALYADLPDGRRLRFALPADAVFEDLTPRLVDLDRDGREEILVVKATQAAGASLMVLRIEEDAILPVTETPALGIPNRWQNPAAVEDLDGDGRVDIAVVERPHLDGTLRLWTFEDGRLLPGPARSGFSTHAIGSTVLDMAVVLDLDGEGPPDLLLPDRARTSLVAMTLRDGDWVEIARTRFLAPLVTSVLARDLDGDRRPEVVFGLADGRLVVLVPDLAVGGGRG